VYIKNLSGQSMVLDQHELFFEPKPRGVAINNLTILKTRLAYHSDTHHAASAISLKDERTIVA